jgi:hypothetical protein
MRDYQLVFDEAQAVTTSKVSSVIDFEEIDEPGRGQPLYINIYVDTAFSSDTETIAIDLITSTASSPAAGDEVMRIMEPTAVDSVSGLHEPGLVAKVPLPSTGLKRYVALSYVAPTAVASGKFTSYLSID